MGYFDPNKTGKDQRFNNALRVGRVSDVVSDEGTLALRVVFPDKENVISKPLQLIQQSGGARRSYNVPKIGQSVLCGMLANGDSDGFVIGPFYTTADPPPITDPNRQYTEFADGTKVEFNEATKTMSVDAQGPINIKTAGPATIEAAGEITIKAPTIRLDAANVIITGSLSVEGGAGGDVVTIQGQIRHQGDMETSGTHRDSRGYHS